MAFLTSLPATATLLDLFRAYPETSTPLIEFHEALLRGKSPFSPGERELIATYVSMLNGCRYCEAIHAATATRLGVAKGDLEALTHDVELTGVAEKMKPVLSFVRKLTLEPSSVNESDAQAILAAGWSETALYHTVAVTALFNLMNRLVDGMGIALNPAYVETSSRRLAEHGYAALIDLIEK